MCLTCSCLARSGGMHWFIFSCRRAAAAPQPGRAVCARLLLTCTRFVFSVPLKRAGWWYRALRPAEPCFSPALDTLTGSQGERWPRARLTTHCRQQRRAVPPPRPPPRSAVAGALRLCRSGFLVAALLCFRRLFARSQRLALFPSGWVVFVGDRPPPAAARAHAHDVCASHAHASDPSVAHRPLSTHLFVCSAGRPLPPSMPLRCAAAACQPGGA